MRSSVLGALVVGLVALSAPAVAGHAVAERSAATGSFVVAESAVRVLDTRAGVGVPASVVPARGTVTVDLSGHVPSDATAVTLNVTAVSLTDPTYVTVWQAGTPRPGVSSINLRVLETRANTVTVPVGADGKVSLYNHNGKAHLVADLAGHYDGSGASWYNSVTPQRFLDTRTTSAPFHGQTGRTVSLAGRVPAGTTAVVVNVTAVAPTRDTFLAVTRTVDRPTTSSLNVSAGETTPNLVTVPVSEELNIAVWNNSGVVDVLGDLVGYYAPDTGLAFRPITPTRAYDSRTATWLLPDTQRRVSLGLPAEATTVLFNLTGIGNYYPTHLTAWQAGTPRPGTSTLNLRDQQVVANHAVVGLGAERAVDVYNRAGYTHVIVDAFGYFGSR
ncbi:hypothetical protein [Actinophytocola sediminis]